MEPFLVINRRLKDLYGHVDGKARYRLSWSTTELEKRHGKFNDFYGSIFIRETVGVREVPKYPAYPDRWVLEVLSPQLGTDEVINHNGYEPLFVFDKNGEYLDPEWRAISFIVNRVENPVKRTPKDLELAEEAQMQKEYEFFLDYIGDQQTAYGINEGNAVVVPNLDGVKNNG